MQRCERIYSTLPQILIGINSHLRKSHNALALATHTPRKSFPFGPAPLVEKRENQIG